MKEVEEYSEVFWQRYKEVSDFVKHVKMIERGEGHLQKGSYAKDLVRRDIAFIIYTQY